MQSRAIGTLLRSSAGRHVQFCNAGIYPGDKKESSYLTKSTVGTADFISFYKLEVFLLPGFTMPTAFFFYFWLVLPRGMNPGVTTSFIREADCWWLIIYLWLN